MSAMPTSPPAGWYPAPDGSAGTRWWDGAQWQQNVQPIPSSASVVKFAMATRVLLVICGVLSLVTIGVEAFGISAITVYLDGNDAVFGLLNSYDQMIRAVNILSTIVLLATGVLWVLWQYRIAKHFPGQTRRSPGWHVGSWIVPVICLWFPYENISDLWRAAGRSRPSWQIVWWLCWLVSNFLIQISSSVYTAAEDLEQFRVAMSVSIVGEVLLLAAAPLAWQIVRDITRRTVQRFAVHAPAQA